MYDKINALTSGGAKKKQTGNKTGERIQIGQKDLTNTDQMLIEQTIIDQKTKSTHPTNQEAKEDHHIENYDDHHH